MLSNRSSSGVEERPMMMVLVMMILRAHLCQMRLVRLSNSPCLVIWILISRRRCTRPPRAAISTIPNGGGGGRGSLLGLVLLLLIIRCGAV
jgi:hypothetical protein